MSDPAVPPRPVTPLAGGSWTPPARVVELCSPANDGTPCFSPSGQFVYFSSNREGGLGKYDLYRSRLRGGVFQPPENLGAPINTPNDELDPAVWQEGFQITFSSNRGPGKVYDLYFSRTREVFPEQRPPQWATATAAFFRDNWTTIVFVLAAVLGLILLIWALLAYWSRIPRMVKCGGVAAGLIVLWLLWSAWVDLRIALDKRPPEPVKLYTINIAGLSESQIRYELRMQQAKLAEVKAKAIEVGRVNAELPTVQKQDTQVAPHPTQVQRVQELPPEVKLADLPRPMPLEVDPRTEIDRLEPFEPADQLKVDQLAARQAEPARPTPQQAQVPRRVAELPQVPLTRADQQLEVKPELRTPEATPPPMLEAKPLPQVEILQTAARTEATVRRIEDVPVELQTAAVTPARQQPEARPAARPQEVQRREARQVQPEQVAAARVEQQPTQVHTATPTAEPPKVQTSDVPTVTLAAAEPRTQMRPAVQPIEATPLQVEWTTPVTAERPEADAGSVQVAAAYMDVPEVRTQRAGGQHNPQVTVAAPTPAMFAGSPSPQPVAGTVAEAAAVQQTEIGGPVAASLSPQLDDVPQLARRQEAAPGVQAAEARFIGDPLRLTTTVTPAVHVARAQRAADARIVDSPPPQTPPSAAQGSAEVPVTLAAATRTQTQAASVLAEMDERPQLAATHMPVAAAAQRPTPSAAAAMGQPAERVRPQETAVAAELARSLPTSRPVELQEAPSVLMAAAPGSAARAAEPLLLATAGSELRPEPLEDVRVAVATEAGTPIARQPAGPQLRSGAALGSIARSESAPPAVASALTRVPAPAMQLASSHPDLAGNFRPANEPAPAPAAAANPVRTQAAPRPLPRSDAQLELAAAEPKPAPAPAMAAAAAGPVAAVRRAVWTAPIPPMQLASAEGVLEPAAPARIAAAAQDTAPPMLARPTAPIPLMKAQYAQATDARAAEVGINVRLDVPAPQREVSAPLLPRQVEQVREAALKQFGGSEDTEKAVGRGLTFLAASQDKDGSWSGGQRQARSALAGLSLLSFLGQGHTHMKDGPYRDAVDKAVKWLLKNQKPDGDMRCGGQMYSHAIATIALCEALALTGDPALEKPCRLAVKFILNAQAPNGGWRYEPKQAGDTSVVGWCAMALKSAQMAGIDVPEAAWKNTGAFLDRVSTGRHKGLYGYTGPTADKPALTCEGLFIRLLMGEPPDTKRNQESIEVAMKHLPTERGQRNFYLYYYATLALHYANAAEWPEWNKKLQDALLKTQLDKGKTAGSWEPNTQWGSYGGRVYSTAMAVLMLEVYYRYLPMYRNYEKDTDAVVAAEKPK